LVDISLRPALETDFPAIKALIRDAGINPTGLDWRRFIIAEGKNGQFAGCGQLKPHSDGSVEMASIAVIPEMRHQGVARIIIQEMIKKGPRPLYLTCRSQLGSFYEKFGFRPINGEKLPKYFRRISRLAGIISALHLINDKLLVMVLYQ
jgi:N-acetylglutamate synthase-like GNAT family acetyltransferase